MNWANLGLLTAAITALVGAGVAVYRSRPQRDIDAKTALKIELEIKRESAAYDRRRTIRLLRLEKYMDQSIQYHRAIRDVLAEFLPAGTAIPEPPEPPTVIDEP